MKIVRRYNGVYRYYVYDGEEMVARSDVFLFAKIAAWHYRRVKRAMDKFNAESK